MTKHKLLNTAAPPPAQPEPAPLPETPPRVEPLVHSIATTCTILDLSQTTVYGLLNSGALEAVRYEGVDSVKITTESIKRLVERGRGRAPRAYQQQKGRRIHRSKTNVA